MGTCRNPILRRISMFILSLVMIASAMFIVPPQTAHAESGAYSQYQYQVVHFNGMDWYLISDNSESATSGTVELFAKECLFTTKMFKEETLSYQGNGSDYASSNAKYVLEQFVSGNNNTVTGLNSFRDVSGGIAPTDLTDVGVTGAKLYLLSKAQVDSLPDSLLLCEIPQKSPDPLNDPTYDPDTNTDWNGWWTRTPYDTKNVWIRRCTSSEWIGSTGIHWHFYGIRPALQLDLSVVTFNADTMTFAWDQQVTEPTAKTGLVANGEEQTLLASGASVRDGNNSSGSILYSLDNENWSTSIPKGTDGGRYTVYYKVTGNNKYHEYVGDPITVEIAPQERYAPAPTGITAYYGQTLSEVELPPYYSWIEPDKNVGNVDTGVMFLANYIGPNYWVTKAKSLKKGKTLKLAPTTVKQVRKLKVKKHVALRYESTNKKIATVSKKGVIKAQQKGTCYVFIYAQSGVYKAVKVVVK